MKEHLAYTVYRPETAAHAVMFVIHGMQEHQRRYAGFAKAMNEKGIAVITYDLPGHGETSPDQADRGWFGEKDGWNTLVESAVEICRLAQKEFPGIPVVLFGHSMGTMVGRTFLQLHDGMVDAAVFTGAPNYQPAASVGKLVGAAVAKKEGKRGHSKLMDTLATGGFSKAVKDPRTPLDWLSVNEANVDRYIADPDCGFPFTVQGYCDLFAGMIAMNNIKAYRCAKPGLPILFAAGEGDPCIGGEKGLASSVDTLRKAGYTNITSKLYPGMRHEILNETDADTVINDIAGWVIDHI